MPAQSCYMKKDAASNLSVSQVAMGQLRVPRVPKAIPRGMIGINPLDAPPPEDVIHNVEFVL